MQEAHASAKFNFTKKELSIAFYHRVRAIAYVGVGNDIIRLPVSSDEESSSREIAGN